MLTEQDILRAVVIPILVALAIGGVGAWRRWGWAMTLAAGGGFVAGYAAYGIPSLPPHDGTDWLFWLAIALTVVGTLAARGGQWLGWLAGVGVWVILRPLTGGAISAGMLWGVSAAVAPVGLVLMLGAWHAEGKLGMAWVLASLAVATGAGGLAVFSSNLRIVGIYGLALAAALAPLALLSVRLPTGRGVVLVGVCLLAAILAAGRFYPEPGLSWTGFWVILGSPLVCAAAAFIPLPRPWQRGLVAVAAVALAVGAVAVPAALAAKKAAENPDPWGASGRGGRLDWLHATLVRGSIPSTHTSTI